MYEKVNSRALTRVAQLVGHCSTKQKVASLIPYPGACLDCGFSGGVYKRKPVVVSHTDVSLHLSPSLPLSLLKKKKSGRINYKIV